MVLVGALYVLHIRDRKPPETQLVAPMSPSTGSSFVPATDELPRDPLTSEPVADPAIASDGDVQVNSAPLEMNSGPVQALPGLEGFDLGNVSDSHPALLLAREADDPPWSRNMEAQLMFEMSTALNAPMNLFQVECRSNTCGAVIVAPAGADLGFLDEFRANPRIAFGIAESLGFRGIARSARGNRGEPQAFVAVYFRQADRTVE